MAQGTEKSCCLEVTGGVFSRRIFRDFHRRSTILTRRTALIRTGQRPHSAVYGSAPVLEQGSRRFHPIPSSQNLIINSTIPISTQG